MKNTLRVLGVIAIVAVIGFSMAACDGGGDDYDDPNKLPEPKGKLTVNGLSEYEGKYAFVPSAGLYSGNDLTGYSIFGATGITWSSYYDDKYTTVKISEGKVVIPLYLYIWEEYKSVAYDGNHDLKDFRNLRVCITEYETSYDKSNSDWVYKEKQFYSYSSYSGTLAFVNGNLTVEWEEEW